MPTLALQAQVRTRMVLPTGGVKACTLAVPDTCKVPGPGRVCPAVAQPVHRKELKGAWRSAAMLQLWACLQAISAGAMRPDLRTPEFIGVRIQDQVKPIWKKQITSVGMDSCSPTDGGEALAGGLASCSNAAALDEISGNFRGSHAPQSADPLLKYKWPL